MGDTARCVASVALVVALIAYGLLAPRTVPIGRVFELQTGETVRLTSSPFLLQIIGVGRLWTADGRETGFAEFHISGRSQTRTVSVAVGSPVDLFGRRILLISVDPAGVGHATLRVEEIERPTLE